MMKRNMLAVALLMVGSAAVAADSVATPKAAACSHKSMISRAGCAVKRYGYEKPRAAVQSAGNYAWNGAHSGTSLTTWSDRAVRLTGLVAILYHGVVPATSKVYAYIAAKVGTLSSARK